MKREQLRKGRNNIDIDGSGGSGGSSGIEVVVEEGVEEPSMVSFNSSLLYFDENATW